MPNPQTQYTVTPWRHPSDLLTIRQQLYTPDAPDDRNTALATVRAWKLRGNLPHAIESTALLFTALDFHNSNESTQNATSSTTTDFATRATFTLALSRFVTGFADLGRHRTGPGQSMFDVARSINLPPHFVELRHEAAHEEMPGLARLVARTEEALRWLWGIYWGGLLEQGAGDGEVGATAAEGLGGSREERRVQFKTELKGELKKFRSKRIALLKTPKKNERQLDEGVKESSMAILDRCGTSKKRWGQLVDLLVIDGMIVPSQKFGTSHQERMRGAELLWTNLLITLATSSAQFFKELICTSIAHLPHDAPEERNWTEEPLLDWLAWIKYDEAWEDARKKSLFDIDGLLLQECCLNPGYYTRQFAGELLDVVQDDDFNAHWDPIFEASMLEQETDVDLMEDEDEMEVTNPDGQAIPKQVRLEKADGGSGWVQTESWRPLPIGVVW